MNFGCTNTIFAEKQLNHKKGLVNIALSCRISKQRRVELWGICPWLIKSEGKHMHYSIKFKIVCFCPWWKKLSWGADTKTSLSLVIIRYSSPPLLSVFPLKNWIYLWWKNPGHASILYFYSTKFGVQKNKKGIYLLKKL